MRFFHVVELVEFVGDLFNLGFLLAEGYFGLQKFVRKRRRRCI
jgi:hypothetical protein